MLLVASPNTLALVFQRTRRDSGTFWRFLASQTTKKKKIVRRSLSGRRYSDREGVQLDDEDKSDRLTKFYRDIISPLLTQLSKVIHEDKKKDFKYICIQAGEEKKLVKFLFYSFPP